MNFRRVITALALVAVFAAIASAQLTNTPTLTCTASAATNQTIRSQGVTEKVGDLVLSCKNDLSAAIGANSAGTAVERATIVVDFGVPLTSRLGTAVAAVAPAPAYTPSEIMLLFNDPSTAALGNGPVVGPPAYGQNTSILPCTAAQAIGDWFAIIAGNSLGAAAACPAYQKQDATTGIWVLDSNALGTGGQAANAYQGVVSGNKVTFYNVPLLNSESANVTNFFRVVNARVNASGVSTVTASVAASIPTTAANGQPIAGVRFGIAASQIPTVATTASGVTTLVSQANGISLCSAAAINLSQGNPNAALITFTEGFGTAFKTRVLSLANGVGDTWGLGAGQILPNGTYNFNGAALLNIGSSTVPTLSLSASNTESGVVIPGAPIGTVANPGLAATGTRLKAVFTGLPANVTYYVSANPVIDFRTGVTPPAVIGGQPTATGTNIWAEPMAQGTAATMETQAFTPATLVVGGGPNSIPVVQLIRNADGTAQAVWEVTNATTATESMTFAVYAAFNPSLPIVTGDNAAIQLGFGPTTASTGAVSTLIPRFSALPAAQKFMQVLKCQTSLLFPYLTNAGGYHSAISISNTGKDPFNTAAGVAGTCALNFYGTNAPTAAVTTPSLSAGDTYANLIDSLGLVNFQGYMIAVCDFRFAHGFAYINDGGFTTAMGYLADVMNDTNRGIALQGEAFGQ